MGACTSLFCTSWGGGSHEPGGERRATSSESNFEGRQSPETLSQVGVSDVAQMPPQQRHLLEKKNCGRSSQSSRRCYVSSSPSIPTDCRALSSNDWECAGSRINGRSTVASATAVKPRWSAVKPCAGMTFRVAADTAALTIVCCGRVTRGEAVTTAK